MAVTMHAGTGASVASAVSATEALVAALRNPGCYPHPAANVEVLETHISYVLLAGEFAYKIKKPLRLGFLDFTALASRRFYCEEELRLNRRSAPQLYLEVVAVTGALPNVHMGGSAPVIDYAVKMRRFAQSDILGRRALERFVQPRHVDALAATVARFHEGIDRARPDSSFGTPESIVTSMLENFSDLAELERSPAACDTLRELQDWVRTQHQLLYSRFAMRKFDGFVRECHGDLHLGNVVLVGEEPQLFDALEFSERLRWTDVMNDVAFTMMDLTHHELRRLAFRFLNRYLEETGDYGGLAVLRYYLVYRALVRAKVCAIRAAQIRARPGAVCADGGDCQGYLDLARRLSHRGAPLLILMHGPSGSGKTTVSQRLLEALGAVRVRSDVERKRLLGLAALAPVVTAPEEGAYRPEETVRTYAQLAEVARESLEAGFPTIVDATFLSRSQRDAFRDLARNSGAGCEIAACAASAAVLRARVERRAKERNDASDADIRVLDWQLARTEPLEPDERIRSIALDTTHPLEWQDAVESLARRFRVAAA